MTIYVLVSLVCLMPDKACVSKVLEQFESKQKCEAVKAESMFVHCLKTKAMERKQE